MMSQLQCELVGVSPVDVFQTHCCCVGHHRELGTSTSLVQPCVRVPDAPRCHIFSPAESQGTFLSPREHGWKATQRERSHHKKNMKKQISVLEFSQWQRYVFWSHETKMLLFAIMTIVTFVWKCGSLNTPSQPWIMMTSSGKKYKSNNSQEVKVIQVF